MSDTIMTLNRYIMLQSSYIIKVLGSHFNYWNSKTIISRRDHHENLVH